MSRESGYGFGAAMRRRSVLKSMAGVAASAWLPSMDAFAPAPAAGEADLGTYTIGPVSTLTPEAATYELVEFKVPVAGGMEKALSPFRAAEMAMDAEFTLPSGTIMRVPGFYAEDYMLGDSNGIKVAHSQGWRIRFSGPEAGAYRGKVEFRVKGRLAGARALPPFTLKRSNSHGTIRVSAGGPRYLEFVDGTSYFPIGQDVCWTTDVSKSIPSATVASPSLPWDVAFARWFDRMGQNGANWARVFMKPDFYMETGAPWQWDLVNAWKLDLVMEMARRNGIHVCLCFNAERSDNGEAYHGSMDLFRASNTAWGRLLASQQLHFDKFFVNPLCREMFRDKIRYAIARWGWSPHIFSWEFWNEIGTVEHREGMGLWLREMTAFARATDPWHHLIKSSTSGAWEPERWGPEVGDLNDVHPYFGWSGEEGPKNLGEFIPLYSSALYAVGRPFIVGETGIAREVSTKYGLAGDLADKDVTCFHLHESLWGGLFSGAVGTGMVWWWDEHTDRHNGYFRFRAMANFVEDIQPSHENFLRGALSYVSTDELRLLELIGRQTRLLWIRRTDLDWYSLAVEKKAFSPVESASVAITGLAPGKYRVEYWSSEEGKRLNSAEIAAARTTLDVPLPAVASELALKVRRLGR